MAVRLGGKEWREIVDSCVAVALRRHNHRMLHDPVYRAEQDTLAAEYMRIFAEPKCEG